MAVRDTQRNEVVIRVVYDGPPEAGKTTSVRALAASFGQPTATPEENATGRTQWFDWMEYVGGRFEGSTIRCQVVSVPGQRELDRRRQARLASADVVVFVGDTTAERWPVTLEYLTELSALRDRAEGPIGIVFQANKRDVTGAVALPEIRKQLGEARWQIGVIESVAADGTGIREAFVYAVRLALDRVRELIATNTLRDGTPEEVSPAELLASMRTAEASTLQEAVEQALAQALGDDGIAPLPPPPTVETDPHSVAAALLEEVLAAEVAAAPPLPPIPAVPKPKLALASAPRPPDASVPSGAIWPPVEGRAILTEVSQLELVPRRHANGDWSAGLGSGWRLVTKRDAIYESLDVGRSSLVQWARLHAACTSVVSPHRCIVLAATGDGRWRLWQIVRAEESLRDLVERAHEEHPDDELVDSLWQTAHVLVEVNARLAEAPCDLPCRLDTIGACDASGMYIGLMPEPPAPLPPARASPQMLVATELGPLLAVDLADRRENLARALGTRTDPEGDEVLATLRRILDDRRE